MIPEGIVDLYLEIERRSSFLETFTPPGRRLRDAIKDGARNGRRRIAVLAPRRSSKSHSVLGSQVDHAQNNPGLFYPYIATTASHCEYIAWPMLETIFKQAGLRDVVELRKYNKTWTLPNGSGGKLYGANREDWKSRFRGGGHDIGHVAITEPQDFAIDLLDFCESVIMPVLLDNMGCLILEGTPGEALAGPWYQITRNHAETDPDTGWPMAVADDTDPTGRLGRIPGWLVLSWGVPDNPRMAEKFALMCSELAGVDKAFFLKPGFQREWLGIWVVDLASNVYAYRPDLHGITGHMIRKADRFVLTMDLGEKKTAFTLSSWSETSARIEYIWSFKAGAMRTHHIAHVVRRVIEWVGPLSDHFVELVADPASAQLLGDICDRYGLPFEGAEKTEKQQWIRIVNTDFALRKIAVVLDAKPLMVGPWPIGEGGDSVPVKIEDGQPLAEELVMLKRRLVAKNGINDAAWEEDLRTGDNHCTDCLLYGYRRHYHWMHQAKAEEPPRGSAEAADKEMAELRDEMRASILDMR